MAAFVQIATDQLTITPDCALKPFPNAIARRICPTCGSPLEARFGYLPGQSYVPVGVLDDAEGLAPSLHAHAESALPWLHIADALPRQHGSARATLNESADD